MTIVQVTGFSAKNKNETIKNINICYNDKLTYYFWDVQNIPTKAGVYVIYDIEGECLYVGSTPRRFNINLRIVEHIVSSFFNEYGYEVTCYLTENNVNDILLLERILIASLKPHFNNDKNNKQISETGRKYIDMYKNSTRNYEYWINYNLKSARIAGVPTELVNLKNDIEAVYKGILGNIPYLIQGEVSLPALYENIKKKLTLAQKNGYNLDFNDFVTIMGEVIAAEDLSDGQVAELVLTNKAFRQYIKKKKKSS